MAAAGPGADQFRHVSEQAGQVFGADRDVVAPEPAAPLGWLVRGYNSRGGPVILHAGVSQQVSACAPAADLGIGQDQLVFAFVKLCKRFRRRCRYIHRITARPQNRLESQTGRQFTMDQKDTRQLQYAFPALTAK